MSATRLAWYAAQPPVVDRERAAARKERKTVMKGLRELNQRNEPAGSLARAATFPELITAVVGRSGLVM